MDTHRTAEAPPDGAGEAKTGSSRRLKDWLRSPARWVAYRVLRATPVERCPAFCADLLGVKVPRSVRKLPAKGPEGGSNINIIFELLGRSAGVPGDLAECGVFQGASLLGTGLFVKQHALGKAVLGFDSFEGFDEAVEIDLQLGGQESVDKKVGGFRNTSEEQIRRKVAGLGLGDVVRLHKGYFRETLSAHLGVTFSFVHLDCDIYQSYKDCLEFFYPRLSPGGIILFDEYNDPPWPGCNKAVDEFLADKPERPVEIERDNYQKWYITKQ
jgi:hypothetical protein